MDNPAIKDFDKCNCPADKAMIEKCHDNDPRWVKVCVPSGNTILFHKASVHVTCNAEGCSDCSDACPPVPIKPNVPQPEKTVILKGYGIKEEQLCTDATMSDKCVTLLPANTSINGMTYTDFDAFCAAITMIVTDCNCKCN